MDYKIAIMTGKMRFVRHRQGALESILLLESNMSSAYFSHCALGSIYVAALVRCLSHNQVPQGSGTLHIRGKFHVIHV